MAAFARMTKAERFAAVEPFAGKVCTVRFRASSAGAYERELVGTVVGASDHLTNGNSTGDLIVTASEPGTVFVTVDLRKRSAPGNGAEYRHHAKSIALVHLHSIRPLDPKGN